MRIHLLACLLSVSGVLLSQCVSTHEPGVTTTAPASTTVSAGQAESLDPDPNKPYREMAIQPIAAEPANYTASVICRRDSVGTLLLEMKLNPAQRSIEKLSLAYGLRNSGQKAKQIGQGTGHYDSTSQRYYFSTFYQIITQLPNQQRVYSDLYPVHGWVSTSTNTVGLQL
ncbi:hypothetical protein [Hymenobacter metallicola]|uniref:Uncharacterized protein n=1 Tax=Hymenobacter metallicola TaxID=2563114 RepID=A0A4Z0QEJ7_9BACT|nr:hypothetical protein [Hymenobacter metallicola]TGE28467.1 hypothetical protein E5K02_03090 [Hymenobacter metallicola]